MEKKFLVYWTSKENDELSLTLVQNDLIITKCVTSKVTIILTEHGEAFYLAPLNKLQFKEKIRTLSCNKSVILIITIQGLVFIKGSDTSLTGVLKNTAKPSESFELVEELKNIQAVDCGIGKSHIAVLDISGKLYTWGNNEQGQCGKSSFGLVESTSSFVISKIKCGKYSTGVLTTVGHVYVLGKVFKSSLKSSNKAFMLPQLESVIVKDFCIGKFVAVLNNRGQVFLFDGLNKTIKVPIIYKIKQIACNKKALYCIEKNTFILYEWKVSENKPKNLYCKAYEIGCSQIFSSNSNQIFALVNKQTASRFLFNLNKELSWTVPKTKNLVDCQSLFKRKNFEKLSKKFKLKIDHFLVVQNKAAEKIGSVLKKALKGRFKYLWNMSCQNFVFRQALRYKKLEKGVLTIQKAVFRRLGAILCRMKEKKSDKDNDIKISLAKCRVLALKILVISIEKITHKIKSQIFNSFHKEILTKTVNKKSQQNSRLVSQKNSEFSFNFTAKTVLNFCLAVQLVLEKNKTVCLLKGFRAFKSGLFLVSRSNCSILSLRHSRHSSESFSSIYTVSEPFKIDYKRNKAKRFSIDFSKKIEKFDRKALISNRNLLTERDFKSKTVQKKDDKFLIKKIEKNKEFDRKNHAGKNRFFNIKEFEKIMKKIVDRRIGAIKNYLIGEQGQPKIEDWKKKVFFLGFHNLLMGVHKNLKKNLNILTKN